MAWRTHLDYHRVNVFKHTFLGPWDEDSRARCPLKVVLLGSAPLLMQRGFTESLAGRFEVVRLPHWSYAEMRCARPSGFRWSSTCTSAVIRESRRSSRIRNAGGATFSMP